MKKSILLFVAALALLVSCGDNPERSRIALDKGIDLLYNTSRFDEAEEAFTEAIKYDKNNADAEFALGRIYFLKDDRDMSCYYYKASMQHGRANVEDDVKGCP